MLFPSCSASLQEAAMGSRMVWVPVVSGPLAPYAAGFESWLGSRAYSASAAADRLYQFDQLSRWLGRERLSAGDLTGEHAGRFAAGRRAAGLKSFSSPQSVALPLEYLRQLGVAPVPAPASPQGPLEELLADYCRYLSVERGLSDHTVFDAYRPAARLFLSGRENPDGLGLDRLSAAEVSSFLAGECGTVPSRRADARDGDRGVLGSDLLGAHSGRQAVQDDADRHAGPGDHRLAVHHPRVGGDHLHLLGRHSLSLPRRPREREPATPTPSPSSIWPNASWILCRIDQPGAPGSPGGTAVQAESRSAIPKVPSPRTVTA